MTTTAARAPRPVADGALPVHRRRPRLRWSLPSR